MPATKNFTSVVSMLHQYLTNLQSSNFVLQARSAGVLSKSGEDEQQRKLRFVKNFADHLQNCC